MNRVFKAFKYMITDSIKPFLVFYLVVLLVIALAGAAPVLFPKASMAFEGIEFATTIFLFVVGLNSFKSGYLFLQANGITRRQYYCAGVLSIAAITVSMTVIDAVLNGILGLFFDLNHRLSELVYPGGGLFGGFLWTLAVNLAAVFAGWFVTMLYYRASKPVKLAISLIPAVLVVGLPILENVLGLGSLQKPVTEFFRLIFGLNPAGGNPVIGALSITVLAALLAGLSFLLVRRAPVKEQDR